MKSISGTGTSRYLLRLLKTVQDNDDDLKADILNKLTSLSTKVSSILEKLLFFPRKGERVHPKGELKKT